MRPVSRLVFLLLLILVALPAPARDPVPPMERLLEWVVPTPEEEPWLRIPWRTHLWSARMEAAAEGRPMLLWSMDGNPIGCT